jgi:hypothetical protein
MTTIAIRARLAATSTGAKYKRIDGHTAFPDMASRVPPCEPLRSRRHCRGCGAGKWPLPACAKPAALTGRAPLYANGLSPPKRIIYIGTRICVSAQCLNLVSALTF